MTASNGHVNQSDTRSERECRPCWEEMAHEQLDKMWAMGVNFLDTAELYPVGWNYGAVTEKWMGNWLEKRVADGSVDRSKLYIATKVNPMGIGAEHEARGVAPHGFDSEIVTWSCNKSIERLKCEYIDLYQIHWPTRDTPLMSTPTFAPGDKNRFMPSFDKGTQEDFDRTVKSIMDLFDAKLIKHWGVSNENAFGITMLCTTCVKLGCPLPVSCQNDFSILNQTYEEDTYEAAHRFGIVGLPYGALCGGTLTGKYFDKTKPQYAAKDAAERPLDQCRHRIKADFQPRYGEKSPMAATAEVVELAEAWGVTPTELSLAWAIARPCNASVIIGTTTVRQVEECVNAALLDLPEELMAAVDKIHEKYRNPCMFYADKEAWKAVDGITAFEPEV
jgi:aryl-alcohol dehydrogenase-like predicted oxidoreductase